MHDSHKQNFSTRKWLKMYENLLLVDLLGKIYGSHIEIAHKLLEIRQINKIVIFGSEMKPKKSAKITAPRWLCTLLLLEFTKNWF